MGISRLESIIRSTNTQQQEKINRLISFPEPKTFSKMKNSIVNISLNNLPALPNTRKYPHIRTVVIDTSEFIYKSIIGGDHTSGILNFLEKMARCKLMPIFVFDGKPPKEKSRILEERKRIKERARERVVSLQDQITQVDELINIFESNQKQCQYSNISCDIDDVNKTTINPFDISEVDNMTHGTITTSELYDYDIGSNTTLPNSPSKINYNTLIELLGNSENNMIVEDGTVSIPTDDIIDILRSKITDLHNETKRVGKKTVGIHERQYTDIKELFSQFNIPYIHAGVEAEMICAALVKLGIADYCIGNDMDLFAHGCPRIIRNINFRDNFVDVYYLDAILNNLELSYTEFVDLCILLGSDYTGRLGGVKNYHILEYMQKYRSIEAILDNIDEINAGLQNEFTEEGTPRTVRIPELFNYNEARIIFQTQFTLNQIESLFSYPLDEIYQLYANKCILIRNDYTALASVIEFCQKKCNRLNNMLIIKKINVIIWGNLFKDDKQDDFILVRSKKTSPINIHGRRYDIINDIRSKNNKNFSRVAFGSSPNHAMVMMG